MEDERTWDLLAALGCDTVQGDYVSRPVPAEDLLPWLARWEAARGGSGGDRQAAAPLIEALAAVGLNRHRAVATPRFSFAAECREEGFS